MDVVDIKNRKFLFAVAGPKQRDQSGAVVGCVVLGSDSPGFHLSCATYTDRS